MPDRLTVATQRVLHIGGTSADADAVRNALTGSTGETYDVEWVADLGAGLEKLGADLANAVLLDLPLPGYPGIDGLKTLVGTRPAMPILVIGSDSGDEMARLVVQAGACDYVLRNALDSYWLPRALRYAIERKLSEDAYAAEATRLEERINAAGDALLKTDACGTVTYLNQIAEALTGWTHGEAIGHRLEEVVPTKLAGFSGSSAEAEPASPGSPVATVVPPCVLTRRDGSESIIEQSAAPIEDRFGRLTGARIVLRDVSAARAFASRMSHLATHDLLTDLPNRQLLHDRLARALALARRHHRQLAVLFLDVDRFKYVNDTLGHMLGDELLRAVSAQLTMCVRNSDTVARHGGDEFVVVLSELAHKTDAARSAQKIIEAIGRLETLAGHDLKIGVSIGISVFPDDGVDAESLLTRADMALYLAKNQGRNCYQFFETDLHRRGIERQSMRAALHRALETHELELFYQPKVNVKTRAITGAEALIRWRHAGRGLIEPDQFIPIAKECGLIKPIGRWVLHEACRQARAWQDAGLDPIAVSVNISEIEFGNKDFLNDVVNGLGEAGLDPRYLELEITEGVLMAHVESTKSLLRALKTVGVELAIDDFGTGWCNFDYLRHFPIDALKIHQSLVQQIAASADAVQTIKGVITIGRRLERRVIAEGVETTDQLAFLRAEDCAEAQGDYFSRALPAPQFAEMLTSVKGD